MQVKKVFYMLVGAAFLCGATAAYAVDSDELTKDEAKCQAAVSKELGKFTMKKVKCVTKCDKKDPGNCGPPYSGDTAACIAKFEGKSDDKMNGKCAADCPECYIAQQGSCPDKISNDLAFVETLVDSQASLVLCDDSGSGDGLTKDELKCRDKAADTLAKYAASVGKCLAKCRKSETKGKTDGSCCGSVCAADGIPDPACDSKTAACINKATSKTSDKIGKVCADEPECLINLGGIQGFVATVANLTSGVDTGTFCYNPATDCSPSGAFIVSVPTLLQ